ncbi:MAG: methyltransferase domain-containing protein [Anaerolineae bacterium]|nr:methyltransferase domain-containing protein [Anaerolineae bacterium]
MEAPQQQSLDAKRAESSRPFHGEGIIKDPNLAAMHRERCNTIVNDAKELRERGVSLGPFLEIGAGSAQRSIALLNNFPTDGVATDISLQSLRDSRYILSLMNYARKPMLICCDAHHIPFMANTFQFVFAYQALHHFENPIPVVAECYRVLGKGGYFYFNEEPMDSPVLRLLRGNRSLSRPPTRLQRLGYKLRVEKIFWDDGAWERSLGMTEARFDIGLWREALRPFSRVSLEISRRLRLHTDLHRPLLNTLLASITGGNVKGPCEKAEGEPASSDFRERLICLDCRSTQLVQEGGGLLCANCRRAYPIIDGIIRLLPRAIEAQLYPASSSN